MLAALVGRAPTTTQPPTNGAVASLRWLVLAALVLLVAGAILLARTRRLS